MQWNATQKSTTPKVVFLIRVFWIRAGAEQCRAISPQKGPRETKQLVKEVVQAENCSHIGRQAHMHACTFPHLHMCTFAQLVNILFYGRSFMGRYHLKKKEEFYEIYKMGTRHFFWSLTLMIHNIDLLTLFCLAMFGDALHCTNVITNLSGRALWGITWAHAAQHTGEKLNNCPSIWGRDVFALA